jgi:glycerol-3-phosphate dehydrogenase
MATTHTPSASARSSALRSTRSDEGDSAALSRDYQLELDTREAPLLHVLGGKLTTYRRLACDALERLAPLLRASGRDWTATVALPGGDLETGFDAFVEQLYSDCPDLPGGLLYRLARHYGSRVYILWGVAREPADLGACLGADLYEAELAYLVDHEWAHPSPTPRLCAVSVAASAGRVAPRATRGFGASR